VKSLAIKKPEKQSKCSFTGPASSMLSIQEESQNPNRDIWNQVKHIQRYISNSNKPKTSWHLRAPFRQAKLWLQYRRLLHRNTDTRHRFVQWLLSEVFLSFRYCWQISPNPWNSSYWRHSCRMCKLLWSLLLSHLNCKLSKCQMLRLW